MIFIEVEKVKALEYNLIIFYLMTYVSIWSLEGWNPLLTCPLACYQDLITD